MRWGKSAQKNYDFLEPDEIFMDSKNLPGFERERFEGRLEYPLSKNAFLYLGAVIAVAGSLFWYKAFALQVAEGEAFLARAEANRLRIEPLWPDRGLIVDRRGEIMADSESAFRLVEQTGRKENIILGIFYDWQEAEQARKAHKDKPVSIQTFSTRKYNGKEELSHLLGYIGHPTVDDVKEIAGRWRTLLGKTGVEEIYEEYLKGSVGSKLTEVNAEGALSSETMREPQKNGQEAHLTVDAGLQREAYRSVKEIVETRGFKGGSSVILDIHTGEVLALVSFPGFDPNIVSRGKPADEISKILTDSSKPFFNRAVSGLYSTGSVIKPFLALAALEEKVITPEKQILSTGSLSVPNPFKPGEATVFKDWKAHGWVDMRRAIGVSSNVYFYTIGGGFGDVKGLGVTKIREWIKRFGISEKTGIDLTNEKAGFIPGPEWKAAVNKNDPTWRIGDTYHLSIGQDNLQVTPIQMAVAVASIANGGNILEPHVLKEIKDGNGETVAKTAPKVRRQLSIAPEYFQVVREGMRLTTTEIGTAPVMASLPIAIGAKTGTAELGVVRKRVNSWFIGFAPFDNPNTGRPIK